MQFLTNDVVLPYWQTVMSAFLVLISVTLVYVCWNYCKFYRAYAKFPSIHQEIQMVLEVITRRNSKDVPFTSYVFQKILEMCRRFQKEGFCIVWFFRPYIFIYSEEFFKRLFNEPAAADKMVLYELTNEVFGSGLLTSNGALWKNHRKLLNPTFRLGVLKGHMHIFNKNASLLVKELEDIVETPNTDIMGILKRCSFNIMAESILELKLNDEKYGHKIEKFMISLEKATEMIIHIGVRPWLHTKILLPFFSHGRTYLKMAEEMNSFTEDILLEMKKSIMDSEAPKRDLDIEEESKNSFARCLLQQHLKDPTFTMTDVTDHVKTIMIGGHDTTANALIYCLYLLGLHPEHQEKALKEAESIQGTDVTYDNLNDLKYLECIIKETLRLYPVVPMYGRKLNKDVQCGNHTILKGTDITFFVYLMHRNPNIYSDPEKFDPQRFFESSDIRPWMYTPFADGYRSCIGKKFALMEMKVILAHILRHFQIKTMEKIKETDLEWNIFMNTAKPVRLLFKFRQTRSFNFG